MLNTTRIEERKKLPLRNSELYIVIIIGKSVKIWKTENTRREKGKPKKGKPKEKNYFFFEVQTNNKFLEKKLRQNIWRKIFTFESGSNNPFDVDTY